MSLTIDKSDMYSVLEAFPEQCKEAYKLPGELQVNHEVNQIVVCGMGGSAIAGDILKAYLENTGDKIRVRTVRDYMLPSDVDEKTLVFAVSYSGNTEETISAYREATKKRAQIVIITSGGKLEELSRMNDTPIVKIPSGLQPRNATGYLFFPLLRIVENSGLIKSKKDEVEETLEKLTPKTFVENAKHLAEKLEGKIPIVYTSNKLSVAGYRWKTQFNENAKIHAFFNVYPEFNHNEINGYVNLNGEYYVVQLMDENEHPRTKKRMEVVKEIIINMGVSVTTLMVKGSPLYKLFSAMYLGDWTSYFLALKNGTDPTPVEIIEELKKLMKE